jgi:hypothetical protein
MKKFGILSFVLIGFIQSQAVAQYQLIDLGTLGGSSSFARALNENRQVTGNAQTPATEPAPRLNAFSWSSPGPMTNLGVLPGSNNFSRGYAINSSGVIVGESDNNNSRAFRWDSVNGMVGLIRLAIPIWTTECEQADKQEACGGADCSAGMCWSAWTRQIAVVSVQTPVIGVSCFYKAHERDLARYGDKAGWIKLAIDFFQTVPSKHNANPIPTSRLVAVLQGWNVNEEEIAAQISQATAADVRGILLVETPIDQSWEPKMHKVKKSEGRSSMVQ